jgi:prepilin-type N-terminal cleavage/methylation domain-containing protein
MRNQRGYSLVELLVVLALMGLIAVAMSGGIRFGTRVWERTGAQVETQEQMQGAQALLRAVLSRTAPRLFDPVLAAQETFAGSPNQMSFIATMPPALGGSGLARFTLQASPSDDGVALQIAWTPERGERTERRQVLLRGARAISFAYAKVEPGSGPQWSESWASDLGMPALVRIRADFAQSATHHWPELIVRARIDRDSSCIFDPVSFECRRG